MKKSGFWYIFSYGLSMLYPLMLTVVGETPYLSMRKWIAWLALWQVMAAVLSIVALLKYKKKRGPHAFCYEFNFCRGRRCIYELCGYSLSYIYSFSERVTRRRNLLHNAGGQNYAEK